MFVGWREMVAWPGEQESHYSPSETTGVGIPSNNLCLLPLIGSGQESRYYNCVKETH